jgi:hypothetical protein
MAPLKTPITILKAKFCHLKPKSNGNLVVGLLDATLLDEQVFFLKMKNNNHDALHPLLNYNPTTKLWGCLTLNAIMVEKLSKFMKLVEISIGMVFGSVVDKRGFSMINFTKSNFIIV